MINMYRFCIDMWIPAILPDTASLSVPQSPRGQHRVPRDPRVKIPSNSWHHQSGIITYQLSMVSNILRSPDRYIQFSSLESTVSYLRYPLFIHSVLQMSPFSAPRISHLPGGLQVPMYHTSIGRAAHALEPAMGVTVDHQVRGDGLVNSLGP